MSLSAISQFAAGWTASSNYIVDFQRGLVTHSKTLTKGQFRRYMRTQNNIQRADLNPRQAQSYYNAYNIGQRYLLFLQHEANCAYQKFGNQASLAYVYQHKDVFTKSLQTFSYPVVQYHGGGHIRTKYERQLIHNYMKNLLKNSYEYGMLSWQKGSEQVYIQSATNKLRKIAFKQRSKQVQTPVAADQE